MPGAGQGVETAPSVDDLAALVQLEQLEERRDRATLAKLAILYAELGKLANLYANVLENAQRQKVANDPVISPFRVPLPCGV